MFFLFPVSVDHRAGRRPLVTLWILGLCVLLYVASFAIWVTGGEAGFARFIELLGFIPARPWIHTWITSLFTHLGLFHLLGNMVYLYLFGACMEDLLGHWRFLGFYLAAGVVSILGHVLMSTSGWRSEIPLVGASGAISGCMGACAVLLHGMKVEFRFAYFFIFVAGVRTFFLPSWLMMALWFADDLLGLFQSLGQAGGGVAFGAHVAGFLFGLGAAYIVRQRVERGDFDDQEPVATAPAAVASGPPPVILFYNNLQHGPLPVHEVWHQVRSGEIPADAFYWSEASQEWRSVAEL